MPDHMQVPSCPDPTHAGSRVVRAGLYGKKPHQRQRWKCIPEGGEAHRFAETLPRQLARAHVCVECETHVERWEGPQTARLYDFTTRQVAQALIRVAGGLSYRSTADLIRTTADRRRGPSTRPAPKAKRNSDPNSHGQIVCNWVDVFADVIWDHYAPKAWPKQLVLDAGEFRTSAMLPTGVRSSRNLRAFFVLAAVGYLPGSSRPRLWLAQAAGRENEKTWTELLSGFDGTPELIVTDGSARIAKAVSTVFPRPGDAPPWMRRCEWHLGKNIRDTLPAHIAKDPEHPLMRQLHYAFFSQNSWASFETFAYAEADRTGGLKGLRRWLGLNGAMVSAQLAARPRYGPASVGAVEKSLQEIQRRIGQRAGAFGNQARTNRLLKLVTLDINGQADERRWADIIRRHLIAQGCAADHQRTNDDKKGYRSLRA